MSHGDHASHRDNVRCIRAAADKAGKHITILMTCAAEDPGWRFEAGGIELRDGATVTVTTAAVTGRDGLIPSQYKTLAKMSPRRTHLLDTASWNCLSCRSRVRSALSRRARDGSPITKA